MPTATDRVTFEGRRTTRRTVAMLKEVRRLTGLRLPISQGGYNAGGVRASAGTHDRDALDLATANLTAAKCRQVERAAWKVGFAGWWRRYLWNVWPQHHHLIPRGGDLSNGAAAQVRAADNGRDGLAGNRPYPGIGAYRGRTWETYLRQRDGSKLRIAGKVYPDVSAVSIKWLTYSWRTGKFSRHTAIVQIWLRRLRFYRQKIDGIPGPYTKRALDQFRRSLGWPEKDCVGLPGITSITILRSRAKSPRKVRP